MLKRYFSKTNLCWIALAAVAFTVVTVLINAGLLGSYYQITLYNICINIILAVSLNLIIGICGQFSLGHAGFMCIGAYSAAIMVKSMPNMGGFAIGIVIGLIISAIAALIVSIPTLRLRGDYLAIATLGFSEIIRIVVLNMEITNGAAGITGIPQLTSWPLLFIVMVLSALYACNFFVIQPDLFNFNKSIDILVMVVFGGMGSITGSLIAAIFIGILNTVLQSFSSIRMIIYGLALVGIMIFRPGGLLGTKEFTFSALFKRRKKKGGEKE